MSSFSLIDYETVWAYAPMQGVGGGLQVPCIFCLLVPKMKKKGMYVYHMLNTNDTQGERLYNWPLGSFTLSSSSPGAK